MPQIHFLSKKSKFQQYNSIYVECLNVNIYIVYIHMQAYLLKCMCTVKQKRNAVMMNKKF